MYTQQQNTPSIRSIMADIRWIEPEEMVGGLDPSEIELVNLGYQCFHWQLLIFNEDIDLNRLVIRTDKCIEIKKMTVLGNDQGRRYTLHLWFPGADRRTDYVMDNDEPLRFLDQQVMTISTHSPRELRFWLKPKDVPKDAE